MQTRMGLTLAASCLAATAVFANCGSCAGDAAKEVKGCCGACPAVKADAKAGATVDTAGLKALLDEKKPVTLLDARSGKFDDGKRIAGAKALNASSSDEAIAAALPSKDAPIVTYCAGLKCPASHALAEKLGKLGYTHVTEYPEGIEGWLKAGHPVEEKAK